jgi:hypothetical protein
MIPGVLKSQAFNLRSRAQQYLIANCDEARARTQDMQDTTFLTWLTSTISPALTLYGFCFVRNLTLSSTPAAPHKLFELPWNPANYHPDQGSLHQDRSRRQRAAFSSGVRTLTIARDSWRAAIGKSVA